MMTWRMAAVGMMMGGACALHADPAPETAPAVPGTQLTWEDCVRLATRENPDLQASREAVLNSDAVHMGAYSALYPQITASFGDTRGYQGANLYSPYVYSTSYSEQLSLSQTIFNGFLTKGNIDQARAQLNLAFANLDSEKAVVSFNLKSAFAQLIYAQKLIKISRDVIDIQQKNARLVGLLYEGGSEDKGNMQLSQANLDQAVYNLDQAVRTRDLSGIQLGVYIGRNLPAPVLAEGELQTDILPVMPDFNKLALITPAYFQQRAQVDAAAAGVTVANSGWYPTVTANAAAYRSDSQFPLKNHGWSAGFSVSYPIFQGGATYFDVKAADASLRQALDNLRSGTNNAALTLAQMFKNMVDAEDNVRIQKELLDATALRYKIAEADYRNGLMSFQDFNTITESYVSQLQTLLSAQLSAVIAEAAWEEARGLGAIP
ncbi:MAG TPA: TolC family protein [Candidatus Methylacidiphilales bacterium]|jgi:outer membrane protein TolC|nr:TolC family protein [Candidatus Methylacidiphilales bacterium]